MRRCIAPFTLLALLAGCFAPSAPTGAFCAGPEAAVRCPSGLVCVAHDGVETCEVTGAAADAGAGELDPDAAPADGDRDNDGLLDAADNCPDAANLDQSNEDGDALGDVCDPCPPFATNADGDGDGLGDACDPNPAAPGDKLVAFHGFSQPLPPAWVSSGSFVINNGEGSLIAGNDATSLLSVASPPGAQVEIRAALVIDLITASANNLGSISLIDRQQPGTDRAIACQLSGLVDGTQEELRIFDASSTTVVTRAPHAFATGVKKELRLRRKSTSYRCHVTGPAQELAGSATFAPAAPRIGIRAHGAAARFHWMMLVTSP